MGIFVPGVIQHRPAKGVSALLEIVTNCKRRLGLGARPGNSTLCGPAAARILRSPESPDFLPP
jgi:hypothetical protein